jgi:RHS repeat-associated protein
LGSSRLATTPSKTLYSSTAYAPFGEPYKQAGTTDLSFTGQDQDTASGMHDFPDRRYMPVQGRWLSPDPAGLAAVDPSSPQSWNRYAYVSNNPLALVDPFGDDACYAIGDASCEGPYYGGAVWYETVDPYGNITFSHKAYNPNNPSQTYIGTDPTVTPPGPTNGSIQNTMNTTPWATPGSPGEFDSLDAELYFGVTPGTASALAVLNSILSTLWGNAWSPPPGSSAVNAVPPNMQVSTLDLLWSAVGGYVPSGWAINGLPAGPSWTQMVKQNCAQAAQAVELWIQQNGTTQPPPGNLISATLTCGQQPE